MMTLRSRNRQFIVPLLVVPLLLVASCGGSDTSASDSHPAASAPSTQSNGAAPDASDVDADANEQFVCDLFSDEEIREITGAEVVEATGSTSQLPVCDWELSMPESDDVVGLPLLAVVLLPESDFRSRVDPLEASLQDIDGPADEIKLHYVGGGDSGIPARMTFFALKGNQGLQIMPGFDMWDNEAAAKSALIDMAGKIFDRL